MVLQVCGYSVVQGACMEFFVKKADKRFSSLFGNAVFFVAQLKGIGGHFVLKYGGYQKPVHYRPERFHHIKNQRWHFVAITVHNAKRRVEANAKYCAFGLVAQHAVQVVDANVKGIAGFAFYTVCKSKRWW